MAFYQLLHLAALPELAQQVRGVEETGLQEENKGNPLVVGLVLHLVPLLVVLSDTLQPG